MQNQNESFYKSTKSLLDLFHHAGFSPSIAIRLPDVIDITSNVRVGSEQPWKDSSAMRFGTNHKKVYVIDSSSPGGYACIGKVSNNNVESVTLEGAWWFVCDSALDDSYMSYRFLEKYLRFDSMDFAYTMYGELITPGGLNSGHGWSGILLKPWSEVDLKDCSHLVSPAASEHPFLLFISKQQKSLPDGSLYVFKNLATQTHIPIHFHDQRIGFAEGFRMVSLGEMICFRFTLYEYNKDFIPLNLLWKNHIIISRSSATAAACRGCFITRFDVDLPPPEILKSF